MSHLVSGMNSFVCLHAFLVLFSAVLKILEIVEMIRTGLSSPTRLVNIPLKMRSHSLAMQG